MVWGWGRQTPSATGGGVVPDDWPRGSVDRHSRVRAPLCQWCPASGSAHQRDALIEAEGDWRMPDDSEAFKEQVVRTMIPPNAESVAEVHRGTGVSQPTLEAISENRHPDCNCLEDIESLTPSVFSTPLRNFSWSWSFGIRFRQRQRTEPATTCSGSGSAGRSFYGTHRIPGAIVFKQRAKSCPLIGPPPMSLLHPSV